MPKSINDVQAYWDASPCFTKRSSAPRDSKQFMDETEARKFKSEPKIPEFANYEEWSGAAVLEIGCGIGIDTVAFARVGAKVAAIDLSEESIKLARKRAELAGVEIKFWQMNAEHNPPTWKNIVDLVYAFGSIHHSPNPEKIIANAREWLRPGGTLKIMVYNKYSWKSLWVLLKYGYGQFWKFDELIARYSEAQTGCPITYVYSPRELRAMLERNGFVVRKMYKDHIFPYEIEAYKQHRYEKTWYWKLVPSPVFKWLERHFGWHILVEATC